MGKTQLNDRTSLGSDKMLSTPSYRLKTQSNTLRENQPVNEVEEPNGRG